MPLRPQCNRLAVSFGAEASYGLQVPQAEIDKRINPREPVILSLSKSRIYNEAVIKGNEFATDPDNRTVVTSRDIEIPFSFDAGLSTLGWCLALAFGGVTSTAVPGVAGSFSHDFFAVDLCAVDQYPSTSMILGFVGADESIKLVKGVIINELRIAMTEAGILEVSGTLFTDGVLTDVTAPFSFPTDDMNDTGEFLYHSHSNFLTANAGVTPLVSKKSLLRGFEFTVNNNLDRDDARSQLANSPITLAELRTGNREITLNVSVEGHQGDEFWDDFEADQDKDVQILVEITPPAANVAGRFLEIRARNTLIDAIADVGFDGIRDRQRIEYKLHAAAGSTYSTALGTVVTPVLAQVGNGDAAYIV